MMMAPSPLSKLEQGDDLVWADIGKHGTVQGDGQRSVKERRGGELAEDISIRTPKTSECDKDANRTMIKES